MNKTLNAKKTQLLTLAALLTAGAIGTTTTMAYLTDNESHTNTFTVGNVTTDLEEPHWDTTDENDDGTPDAAENIVALQEVSKDPVMHNTGDNDAVVFLKVTVPVKTVKTAALDGTLEEEKAQEIFYLKDEADAVTALVNHFDENWIELSDKEDGTDYSTDTRTYVFGYKTKLAAKSKTEPLFDKVQLKNVVEGSLESDVANDILVEGYALQATSLYEGTTDLTASLTDTNLSKIYDIFMNQNSELKTSSSTVEADTNGNTNLSGN